MELTENDYNRLKEHRQTIEQSARLGYQRDTSPWYVMSEIKMNHTGIASNGHCGACVIDLYREFWQYIEDYEKNQNGR